MESGRSICKTARIGICGVDGKYTKKNRCLVEDDIDKRITQDIFSINEELSVSSDVRHYVKDIMKLISDTLNK